MRKLILIPWVASALNLPAQSAPAVAATTVLSAPAPALSSAPSSPAAAAVQPVASVAASNPATPAPAPALNERRASHVVLIVDATHNFAVDLPASPIIRDDEINMIPGEAFLLEVEVEKGRLIHLRRVEIIVHPERTLSLKFSQNPERGSPYMMFNISNPFKQDLKYRSRIVHAGKTNFVETSNVGVGPEIQSFESWNEPIVRLLLSDFQLIQSAANR